MNNWQRDLAERTTPEWSGDLNDDCTALWAGLILRAELMQDDIWWWCVYDNELPQDVHQVRSSNDEELPECRSGDQARKAAEVAAKRYLGLKV